jgi:hypothetical protein
MINSYTLRPSFEHGTVMNKTALLSTIALMLPICTLAATNNVASDNLFNGIYLGAQAGTTTVWSSHDSTSTMTVEKGGSLAPSVSVPVSDDASNIGATGGLHLGYGHAFKRIYLGGEFNGQLESVNIDSHSIPSAQLADSFSTTQFTAKLHSTYGFNLKPGVLLTPSVLFYAKIGIQRSYIDASSTTNFQSIPGVTEQTYVGSVDGSSYITGLQGGLGIEKRTAHNFSIYVEDLLTGYNSSSIDNVQPISGTGVHSGSNIENKATFTPRSNILVLGASYYFN